MLPNFSLNTKYSREGGGPFFKGTRISTNDLIIYLESITELPVKDKTEIDFVFDMELNWSIEKPKTLNEELKKYGLKLKKI